jgi:hypothetical protein
MSAPFAGAPSVLSADIILCVLPPLREAHWGVSRLSATLSSPGRESWEGRTVSARPVAPVGAAPISAAALRLERNPRCRSPGTDVPGY